MKVYALASLIVLLALGLYFVQISFLHAPELFGTGILYALRVGNVSVGIVHGWGLFGMVATSNTCTIYPILPQVVDAQEPIRCKMIYNENRTAFRGWIDFRGGPHKFCGAVFEINIPAKCFGD